MKPTVTFVVPCYRLAHLLGECLESILTQSYREIEVLVMDDCSPDDTPAVARSFGDDRVRHVRNEPNLGHLRNYNKGIGLARGKYIWLISADDRLRSPEAVARYVHAMERHPDAGYAICPGVSLENGRETSVIRYSHLGDTDRVYRPGEFVRELAVENRVLAAAGMVHRRCYEERGAFPLDLPFAGDWYLWALFALHYGVAYIAEPLVNYREHPGSMTRVLLQDDDTILWSDDLAVRWRILDRIREAGVPELVRTWEEALVSHYVATMQAREYKGVRCKPISVGQLDESLGKYCLEPHNRARLRRAILSRLADALFYDEQYERATEAYASAVGTGDADVATRLKYTLARLGPLGRVVRRGIGAGRASARIAGSRHDGPGA